MLELYTQLKFLQVTSQFVLFLSDFWNGSILQSSAYKKRKRMDQQTYEEWKSTVLASKNQSGQKGEMLSITKSSRNI